MGRGRLAERARSANLLKLLGVTMSIPESAPLRLASDGPTSGKIMLKVEIDPDTLEIDLDLMETEFDSIIAIRINGLPVPPFLLFGE